MPKPPSIESSESVELNIFGEPRVASTPGLDVSKMMKRFCSPSGAVDPGTAVVYGAAFGDTAVSYTHLTDSLDSIDGGFGIPPGSITFQNWCDPNNPLIVNIVEEDSTTQTFTTNSNDAPCNGTADGTFTYTGAGWTGTGAGGPAAFSIFQYGTTDTMSGDYQGTFDNGSTFDEGVVGNSAVNITVQNNFSVQGSVTVGANNLCASQTAPLSLSLQDPAAIANGVDPADSVSSISSGDVVEIAAANSTTGDLVFFVLTGTGPDGVAQEPEGTMWATGTYVLSLIHI